MDKPWQSHRKAGEDKRRWPCCLECTPSCTAGCGDEARIVKLSGKLVGAFCRGCYGELSEGRIPGCQPNMPRRPRGPRLRDLQDAHR